MLLRFCFENHRSFKDEACLSLVPTTLKEENTFLIHSDEMKLSALPGCIIYGANASGKSNVIDALRYARHVITYSHSRWDPDDPVPRAHFKLDKSSITAPSKFSVDLCINKVLFHYGFETDEKVFTSEWLYAYPKGVRQLWFERTYQEVRFGKFLRGNLLTIRSLMRKNSLFLSAAAQNNHEQLLPLYRFFGDIAFAGDLFSPGKSIDIDVKRIGKILEFLRHADTGIVDAKVEKEDASDEFRDLMTSIKNIYEKKQVKARKNKKKTTVELRLDDVDSFERISFGHKSSTGDIIFLDLSEESSGTVRLANLLAPILLVIEKGCILALDELDASLHTLLAIKLIEIFNSPELNTNGAQLICTTHDTNILCASSIRRDQIWFVEKDPTGSSHLFPLTDFSTRKTDNLEKGYLDGRYGAIPFLGSVRTLRKKILGS